MVDPKIDESFTDMESVSENILYFLGFEGFAFFVNPVYDLFDANQILPFVQQRRQTMNLERVFFSIVYSQNVHDFSKGLEIHKRAVWPLAWAKVSFAKFHQINKHLFLISRVVVHNDIPS